jgi:hypothetical protein
VRTSREVSRKVKRIFWISERSLDIVNMGG